MEKIHKEPDFSVVKSLKISHRYCLSPKGNICMQTAEAGEASEKQKRICEKCIWSRKK